MNFLQFFLQRVSAFLGSFNQSVSTQSVSTSSAFLFATTEASVVQDVLPTGKPFGLFSQWLFGKGIFGADKQIISVNGNPVEDNQALTLPSGATLSVDSQSGAFIYNPNSAIDAQPGAPVVETFTYTYQGFFGIPITLNAKVIVFDAPDSGNGDDPSDPSTPTAPEVTPKFTQFSDELDLNEVTADHIAELGVDAYQAALAGDDTVALPGIAAALTNAGFYDAPLSGGSGDDSFIIDGTVGLTLNQVIQVIGNSGDDQFIIEPTDTAGQTIGKLTLDGGTGNDRYTFENITSASELSIVESSPLADADILQILSPSDQSLEVADSMFNLGLGDDTYLIDGDLNNSRVVDAAGESSIVITGNVYGDNYDDSSIATGAQNDVVNVTGTVTNASITTGDGDDDVIISGAVTNSVIDVQDGDNTVSTGSLLSSSEVVFGVGDDTVTVDGFTEYSDIRAGGGNNTITLNGNAINANITAAAGTGNQSLTIDGNFTADVVSRGQILFYESVGNHQIDVAGSIIGTDATLLATIASYAPGVTTLSVENDIQFGSIILGDDSDSVTAVNIIDSDIDMGTGGLDQITAVGDRGGMISNSTISMGSSSEAQDNILTVISPTITNSTFILQNPEGSSVNQLVVEGTSVGDNSIFNGSDAIDEISIAVTEFNNSTIDLGGAGNDLLNVNDTVFYQSTLIVGNGNDRVEGNVGFGALQETSINIVGNDGIDSNVTFSIDVSSSTITIEESVKDTDVLTFQGLYGGTLTGSGGLDQINIVNAISSDGTSGAAIDLQSGDDLLTGTGTQPGIINSVINMGIDNDTISGFSTVDSNSQLYLGEGNDTLLMLDTLGWFDDSLVDGGDGDDTIEIVNGNNSTVIDGTGNDTVTIVKGSITIDSANDGFADSFVFEPTDPVAPNFTNGAHTINGFESGSDVVDLTAFNTVGINSITDNGADTTITITGGLYTVTLTGVVLDSSAVGTDILGVMA